MNQKAEILKTKMKEKLDECFPTKTVKFTEDDKP